MRQKVWDMCLPKRGLLARGPLPLRLVALHLLVLCLTALCLSGCAARPHAAPTPQSTGLALWQGPELLVQTTVWATHKGTTIPLQALLRLSAEQHDLSLILVYGSTVGHCQLAGTRAYCTATMPALAPVLAAVGEATARIVHSLVPRGPDARPNEFIAPPHMRFSAQQLSPPASAVPWPAEITVDDAARGITLRYAFTEVTQP